MKSCFTFLLLMFVLSSSAQKNHYWQQEVNYKIDVSLYVNNKTLKGFEQMEYINHSPDTLSYIWFHLWANAYKNKNTAYAKQRDGTYIRNNVGYIDSLSFTIDSIPALTEPHPEHIDILKLILNKPLPPGESVKIQTPFFVKIPEYVSRLGYNKQDFFLTQWYPKPAVYDRKGWHPMPYLDRGEFYSEFGIFDVSITLPSTYVVAASGELTTEDERENYKIIGTKNKNKTAAKYKPTTDSSYKTLRFVQNNIHDFAWFASEDFIIRYTQALLSNQHTVDVFTFSKQNRYSFWSDANIRTSNILFKMKEYVGEYPYGTISVIEGGSNRFSAGMEYPMVCLVGFPDEYVLTHEVVHNWFYGIIGSNERDHAWMDEGITDLYSRYITNQYPSETNSYNSPIDQKAELFENTEAYFSAVYTKAAKWLRLLEDEMGTKNFNAAMKKYFEQWKFRHPYPEDFQQVMEQVSGKKLTKIFALLKQPGKL